MNFSRGHSGTKVQCESCLFSQGKTPEFTNMGEIHELFILALSLVWFAGATPDSVRKKRDALFRELAGCLLLSGGSSLLPPFLSLSGRLLGTFHGFSKYPFAKYPFVSF